ncbi:MAG: helix-turn-helix domain-containing protein [Myxococcales bacterium]
MSATKSVSALYAAPAGRGLLSASVPDGRLEVRRVLPSPDLAPYIHHYGSAHWDLRSPLRVDTLPHPAARIELEVQRNAWSARAVGVRTGRYGNTRSDSGQYFVVQFRPATFQPLLRAALSSLTDRSAPAARLFGARANDWALGVQHAQSLQDEIDLTETFLRTLVPALPPVVAGLRDVVERVGADATLCRVEQVAAAAKLDVRTLQRRFQTYVGVPPKWVIQRYRLQEAAERLRAAAPVTLASLAAELGYADQAHFARDFRRVIGRPPGVFARAQAGH